jgi:hypothetical protein
MLLAGMALGTAASLPAPAQDTGLNLFHKMQKALRGADNIAAIRDFDEIQQADTSTNDGKSIGHVVKRTRWIKRNYLRIDQVGPGDTYVLYFDGTGGWEILPGGTVADLAGGELEFARSYLSSFMLNFWLADRIPGYSIASPSRNVARISIDGRGSDFFLDPASWLPVKSRFVWLTDPSRPARGENETLEWTRVQGVFFPSRVKNSNSRGGVADIRTKKSC